ncbi:autoinhibited Ca(2+)-ATPase, isoform 4 [Prunus dulcis]|uniref:Autoinhibited Ca(2+)-ATPase, isoform 4 n=1 Tax=Prunus dulcis TaxID=3755 RepID=A0A4Y1RMJ0_PRUDU|nr:autoinhibited Ca(2+)-ATPase, isoform 4 [Prunus dulcis]
MPSRGEGSSWRLSICRGKCQNDHGDNVFTAKAIATECGILKPNQDMFSGAVVEGVQFRNYTPEERMLKVDKSV